MLGGLVGGIGNFVSNNIFGTLSSSQALGVIADNPLLFAGGGDMVVGGQGGTDSQSINFRATPGEVVSVRRPGDAGSDFGGNAPTIVQLHVHGATDPDSFQRSSGQVAHTVINAMQRARMRNGA